MLLVKPARGGRAGRIGSVAAWRAAPSHLPYLLLLEEGDVRALVPPIFLLSGRYHLLHLHSYPFPARGNVFMPHRRKERAFISFPVALSCLLCAARDGNVNDEQQLGTCLLYLFLYRRGSIVSRRFSWHACERKDDEEALAALDAPPENLRARRSTRAFAPYAATIRRFWRIYLCSFMPGLSDQFILLLFSPVVVAWRASELWRRFQAAAWQALAAWRWARGRRDCGVALSIWACFYTYACILLALYHKTVSAGALPPACCLPACTALVRWRCLPFCLTLCRCHSAAVAQFVR
jgi:hypothetical protein